MASQKISVGILPAKWSRKAHDCRHLTGASTIKKRCRRTRLGLRQLMKPSRLSKHESEAERSYQEGAPAVLCERRDESTRPHGRHTHENAPCRAIQKKGRCS